MSLSSIINEIELAVFFVCRDWVFLFIASKLTALNLSNRALVVQLLATLEVVAGFNRAVLLNQDFFLELVVVYT